MMALFILSWPLRQAAHVRQAYGVNPWVWGFLWLFAAAPPFYLGILWIARGTRQKNSGLVVRGVVMNRFGVVLAPAYVLIWGHDLGWSQAVFIILPIALTYYFVRFKLQDVAWMEKNEASVVKWATRVERFFEAPIKWVRKKQTNVQGGRHD